MAPQNSENKNLVNSTNSQVHSLKAAIFHTMAYKISLEITNGTLTPLQDVRFRKSFTTSVKLKRNVVILNNFIVSMLKARRLLCAKQPRKQSWF